MTGKAPITIKDIARALSISPSTVSRALKNHPDISQDTKNAVNAYAKEFNYKPNTLALSLRMSKNNTIGVIVPEIIHYFFSSILSGIEQVANAEGYNVILCQSDEKYEKEISNTQALVATRVSGVLASLAKHTKNYDHYRDIMESDIPLVFFDRICTELSTDRVVVDDYTGAFAAVEYLIQTGCKRIAFYSSPVHLEISKNRKNGYLDALRKYGIKTDESLVKVCDTREEAIIITPEILDRPDRPDGFFCTNDHCAAGVLYACKLQKLRVPDNISIMGFSDGELAKACDPMLSTVEQHGYEMGKYAAKLLIDKINGVTRGQFKNKIVKTNLIIRGTTR